MSNPIRPDYYKTLDLESGIECFDVWKALGIAEDACRALIIKYLWRYKDKNGVEDLEKAKDYLDRMIELERAKEVTTQGAADENKGEDYQSELEKINSRIEENEKLFIQRMAESKHQEYFGANEPYGYPKRYTDTEFQSFYNALGNTAKSAHDIGEKMKQSIEKSSDCDKGIPLDCDSGFCGLSKDEPEKKTDDSLSNAFDDLLSDLSEKDWIVKTDGGILRDVRLPNSSYDAL